MATVFELSRNKFYFDEIYDLLIVRPMTILAHVCRIVDMYLVDGLVDLIGQMPAFFGLIWCGRSRTGWCSFTPC